MERSFFKKTKCFKHLQTFSTKNVDNMLKTMWKEDDENHFTTSFTLCLFFRQFFYSLKTTSYQIITIETIYDVC